jgi:hypothetical protein
VSEDRLQQLRELHKKRLLGEIDQAAFERERTRLLERGPSIPMPSPPRSHAASKPWRAAEPRRPEPAGASSDTVAPVPSTPQPLPRVAPTPPSHVRSLTEETTANPPGPSHGRGLLWFGLGWLLVPLFLLVTAIVLTRPGSTSVPSQRTPLVPSPAAPPAPVAEDGDRPVRVGGWVVVVSCCMAGMGSPECEGDGARAWLATRAGRAAHTFILYEAGRDWSAQSIAVHEIDDRPRADLITVEPTAAAGPFHTRERAEAWARAHEAQSDGSCHSLDPWRIAAIGERLAPEERTVSSTESLEGTVTEAEFGNHTGRFVVDVGGRTFSIDCAAGGAPSVGDRIQLEVGEVTLKRAGHVVSTSLEVTDWEVIPGLPSPAPATPEPMAR